MKFLTVALLGTTILASQVPSAHAQGGVTSLSGHEIITEREARAQAYLEGRQQWMMNKDKKFDPYSGVTGYEEKAAAYAAKKKAEEEKAAAAAADHAARMAAYNTYQEQIALEKDAQKKLNAASLGAATPREKVEAQLAALDQMGDDDIRDWRANKRRELEGKLSMLPEDTGVQLGEGRFNELNPVDNRQYVNLGASSGEVATQERIASDMKKLVAEGKTNTAEYAALYAEYNSLRNVGASSGDNTAPPSFGAGESSGRNAFDDAIATDTPNTMPANYNNATTPPPTTSVADNSAALEASQDKFAAAQAKLNANQAAYNEAKAKFDAIPYHKATVYKKNAAKKEMDAAAAQLAASKDQTTLAKLDVEREQRLSSGYTATEQDRARLASAESTLSAAEARLKKAEEEYDKVHKKHARFHGTQGGKTTNELAAAKEAYKKAEQNYAAAAEKVTGTEHEMAYHTRLNEERAKFENKHNGLFNSVVNLAKKKHDVVKDAAEYKNDLAVDGAQHKFETARDAAEFKHDTVRAGAENKFNNIRAAAEYKNDLAVDGAQHKFETARDAAEFKHDTVRAGAENKFNNIRAAAEYKNDLAVDGAQHKFETARDAAEFKHDTVRAGAENKFNNIRAAAEYKNDLAVDGAQHKFETARDAAEFKHDTVRAGAEYKAERTREAAIDKFETMRDFRETEFQREMAIHRGKVAVAQNYHDTKVEVAKDVVKAGNDRHDKKVEVTKKIVESPVKKIKKLFGW